MVSVLDEKDTGTAPAAPTGRREMRDLCDLAM